ncbi:Sbal_3080 family lipoprotein [Pseudomonas sp. KB-10]|uniref:Sbal_3080 family lipoprotein n=1 Tax=Pseudomonas sp. KB-10 TaxID=2292264 RepID=UPI001BAF4F75|nr:Sbal_3080 family lipoprotein [Pseudomonas sp. KB-10]
MPPVRSCLPLLAATVLVGCTATQVTPLQSAADQMCIEENPKVQVSDFVPVLQQGFARHGIETQLYAKIPREQCPYVVTYTARRSWDMAPYLSTAEIVILGPRRQTLAKANYHLRGKGGLSLMKWQGTKSKIDPVIDELLANVQLTATVATEAQRESASPRRKSLDEQIRELQQQHLGYEDYQRAYRKLLLENQASD